MKLSVILPTHNPDVGRLNQTLAGLRHQTLNTTQWELLVIDNASQHFPKIDLAWHPAARIICEPCLGLTAARVCGFQSAQSDLLILVDDDNVLPAHYLQTSLELMQSRPGWGACGGKVVAEFEQPPPAWMLEFTSLLACRDLGEQELESALKTDPATGKFCYPECAPVGAGMVLRKKAIAQWMQSPQNKILSDRKGSSLSSAGDNDLVFSILKEGWKAGYSPDLQVTHLIPSHRCTARYLARLNQGIMKSWVELLEYHGANHWPAIPPWTLPLRLLKAWFTLGPWRSPQNRIRWAGACGQLRGQAAIYS